MKYSYEITPRPVELGGGWRLRLLEDGQEVGGGVFPPVDYIEEQEIAVHEAFIEAEEVANDWLDSREA
jgi:hypothetical protein